MDCAESVALLSDYREGALDETLLVEVRAHLVICPPCAAVFQDLETIIMAASALRQDQDIPFPDETVIWQRLRNTNGPIH